MAAHGAPQTESDEFAPAWPALNPGQAGHGLMDFSLAPSVIDFPVVRFCEHWDALLNHSAE